MFQTDRHRHTITIEGIEYQADQFGVNCEPPIFATKSLFHKQVYSFLKDWFDESPYLKVQTSGSTGSPKKMFVEKERMIQSALMTCSFLNLKNKDKALLCMPVDFIAGKMMIVRSLVSQLDLYVVQPSTYPLADIDVSIDFSAMTPMQVYSCLQTEEGKRRLAKIRLLLIGGGSIDMEMEKKLKLFPNKIFSTYGMTETLSHIALRQLNGDNTSDFYLPFPNIKISLAKDSTLLINAPSIAEGLLKTNDIAEININGSFRIIGRTDNIINSGGIKIQPEEVENILKPYIKTNFAISSIDDARFGEVVVLAVEDNNELSLAEIKKKIPAYTFPKYIIRIDQIPLTQTGKIDRYNLKKNILTILLNK